MHGALTLLSTFSQVESLVSFHQHTGCGLVWLPGLGFKQLPW